MRKNLENNKWKIVNQSDDFNVLKELLLDCLITTDGENGGVIQYWVLNDLRDKKTVLMSIRDLTTFFKKLSINRLKEFEWANDWNENVYRVIEKV